MTLNIHVAYKAFLFHFTAPGQSISGMNIYNFRILDALLQSSVLSVVQPKHCLSVQNVFLLTVTVKVCVSRYSVLFSFVISVFTPCGPKRFDFGF